MNKAEELADLQERCAESWLDGSEPQKFRLETAAELRRLAAENDALKAAVKQARIDALEEAKQACEAEADESKLSAPGASDGRYDWKEDGARDCAAAIESLKGQP